ncbi:ABC transporter permease [Clostridium hydrogeniformans]|uniref:ABC transporter permease n=1 Tax=Clostridium hydrogeniformans TaxID=349933 RepID=UPI00068CC7E5|nr:ABC transporter permease [Clostridium hydrogeniformans]
MLSFIKNNYYRISSRKEYIITSLILTMVSIYLAVLLTSSLELKGNIALVTNKSEEMFKSNYIKINIMSNEPPTSELLLGKYDGVIVDKGHGEYEVNTIKGEEFKEILEAFIKNPKEFKPESKDIRGVGTNIIGYLLMFLLLQSILYMFTLGDDMELKQIERIIASPVSLFKYMLSHFIVVFLLIFLPSFFILTVMKGILGFNIGFSLIQYAVILSIVISLGVSFAMFLNSLIKVSDKTNMMGSAIVILTTILAGSFYSFEKRNKILESALWILPQKSILSFVQGLEGKREVYSMIPELFYVIIISIGFYIIATLKIKKDYIVRKD